LPVPANAYEIGIAAATNATTSTPYRDLRRYHLG